MTARSTLLTLLTLLVGVAMALPRAAAADPCTDLVGLHLRHTTITSATSVPAGPFVPPGSTNPITLPAFCRAVGVATPTSRSTINFEVWMPPAGVWNGRFR